MIIKDFDKKVFFWKVQGIYTQHNTEGCHDAFVLLKNKIQLHITYEIIDNKCKVIMADRTLYYLSRENPMMNFAHIGDDTLAEELEKM